MKLRLVEHRVRLCFYCGEPLGRIWGVINVGGVNKRFHRGPLKDCFNEYLKWRTLKLVKGGKP